MNQTHHGLRGTSSLTVMTPTVFMSIKLAGLTEAPRKFKARLEWEQLRSA